MAAPRILLFLLVLAGCNQTQNEHRATIVVDGLRVGVLQAVSPSTTWSAVTATNPFAYADPEIQMRNIKAIESVSGFRVNPNSINSIYRATYASVDC